MTNYFIDKNKDDSTVNTEQKIQILPVYALNVVYIVLSVMIHNLSISTKNILSNLTCIKYCLG